METISPTKELLTYIDSFSGAGVLVVGDVMVDEFIWGKVERISPEAPVPVVEVERETLLLGGAANVVNNIRALGGKVYAAGIVGKDLMGRHLTSELKKIGVDPEGIVTDETRTTSIKTRVIAHQQQVVRFDREVKSGISPEMTEEVLKYARSLSGQINAIIVADYGKGMVSEKLISELVSISKKDGLILSVDPKVENFSIYRDVTVITPNHYEAGNAARQKIVDDKSLLSAGNTIIKELRCKNVLITQGEEGMTLFEEGGDVVHIPTVAREVFDVTGAGDTVISALTLAVAAGATMRDAAVISNYAAGVVVSEVGTAVVTGEELKEAILFAINNKDRLKIIRRNREEIID